MSCHARDDSLVLWRLLNENNIYKPKTRGIDNCNGAVAEVDARACTQQCSHPNDDDSLAKSISNRFLINFSLLGWDGKITSFSILMLC